MANLKTKLETERDRWENAVESAASDWQRENCKWNVRRCETLLAAIDAGDHVATLGHDRFLARAQELLGPHCQALEGSHISNRNLLGSGLLGNDERERLYALPAHVEVSFGVKTGREPMHSEDFDALGVCSPARQLDAAAHALADEFGLTCKGFCPCEKGWGSYHFVQKSEGEVMS